MSELVAYVGPFLATVLGISCAMKASGGLGAEAALRSALGVMIRPVSWLVIAWRGLVAVEAALALALLVLPARSGGIAAAAFFVAAAAYAGLALRVAPDRDCGCFGAADEPASRLTVVRALLLAAASGAYAAGDTSPLATTSPRAWAGLSALVLLTLLVSREWLAPLQRRRAVRKLRKCSRAVVDTDAAVELMRTTNAWRVIEGYLLRHDPSDSWREGCWQFFSFEAAADGNVATAVFAIGVPPGGASCRAMLRRGTTGPAILETLEERVRWPGALRTRASALIVRRRKAVVSDVRPAA
jgi:hypothetical protein